MRLPQKAKQSVSNQIGDLKSPALIAQPSDPPESPHYTPESGSKKKKLVKKKAEQEEQKQNKLEYQSKKLEERTPSKGKKHNFSPRNQIIATPETPIDFLSGEKSSFKVKKGMKKGKPKKLLNNFIEPQTSPGDETGLSNKSQIENLSSKDTKRQQTMLSRSVSPARGSKKKKISKQSFSNSQINLVKELDQAVLVDKKSQESFVRPKKRTSDQILRTKHLEKEIAEATQQLMQQKEKVKRIEHEVNKMELEEEKIEELMQKDERLHTLQTKDPYDCIESRNSGGYKNLIRGHSEQKTTRQKRKEKLLKPTIVGQVNLDTAQVEEHRNQIQQIIKRKSLSDKGQDEQEQLCNEPLFLKKEEKKLKAQNSVYQRQPQYKLPSELTIPVLAQKEKLNKDLDEKSRISSRRSSLKIGSESGQQQQSVAESSSVKGEKASQRNGYGAQKQKNLNPVLQKPVRKQQEKQPVNQSQIQEKEKLDDLDDITTPVSYQQPRTQSDSFMMPPQDTEEQTEYNQALIQLSKIAQEFNFITLFQEIKKDQESFNTFQRFCYLLLNLHGKSKELEKDSKFMDEFLRELNVYQEMVSIVKRVDEDKFCIEKLQQLEADGRESQHQLQVFINLVVQYARAKRKIERGVIKRKISKKVDNSSSKTSKKMSKKPSKEIQEIKVALKESEEKLLEDASKKKPSLSLKMKSSDDKVIKGKDVESVSSKKPSTKTVKKKTSVAPAVKKKPVTTAKKEQPEVKLTNQDKKEVEDRPLQMVARQEIKKKESQSKLSKVRSNKRIETLAKSSSKQSLVEKIEVKRPGLATQASKGQVTDDVTSDCQTPKQVVRGYLRREEPSYLRKSHNLRSSNKTFKHMQQKSQNRARPANKVNEKLDLHSKERSGAFSARREKREEFQTIGSTQTTPYQTQEKPLSTVRGYQEEENPGKDVPITNLNINIYGQEGGESDKQFQTAEYVPQRKTSSSQEKETQTDRYRRYVREEWAAVQLVEIMKKPALMLLKCEKKSRGTPIYSKPERSESPPQLYKDMKEFSMFDKLEDELGDSIDLRQSYQISENQTPKKKGKKGKKGSKINSKNQSSAHQDYSNCDIELQEAMNTYQNQRDLFTTQQQYQIRDRADSDELQRGLEELKEKSTRHSDLVQRIQDSVTKSQEAYRASCASRSSKVDMSVIEKIKNLRKYKDQETLDNQQDQLERQREETIRKIQERHQRKPQEEELPEMEERQLQKHFSMPDQVTDLAGAELN